MIKENIKLKGLDATTIKFIAIAAMLIDHIGWAFVPTYSILGQVMHIIGRITATIMCFFIAEGYYYTKDVKKYVFRLALFALISHVPFIFFETGQISIIGNTGVIYTLCLSLISVIAYDKIKNKYLRVLSIIALCILAFFGDWMCMAVLMSLNFWKHRGDFKRIAIHHCIITGVFLLIMCSMYRMMGYPISYTFFQGGMVLALPILYLYNGQKGEFATKHKKFSKWVFYIFYPVHLIILGIIKCLV